MCQRVKGFKTSMLHTFYMKQMSTQLLRVWLYFVSVSVCVSALECVHSGTTGQYLSLDLGKFSFSLFSWSHDHHLHNFYFFLCCSLYTKFHKSLFTSAPELGSPVLAPVLTTAFHSFNPTPLFHYLESQTNPIPSVSESTLSMIRRASLPVPTAGGPKQASFRRFNAFSAL